MLTPYYIYRHIRPDTNEVFYVGKGKNRRKTYLYERAHCAVSRNIFWRRIVDKCKGEYEVEIVMEFETPEECVAKEKELIALYGRRDLKKGTLCNLTDGGDGGYGRLYSEEQRLARSERTKGDKHPSWGKKFSDELRQKLSEAQLRSPLAMKKGDTLPEWWKDKIRQTKFGERNPMHGKTGKLHHLAIAIRDTSNGNIYYGVKDAALAAGVGIKSMYNYLEGTRPNKTSMVREERYAPTVS